MPRPEDSIARAIAALGRALRAAGMDAGIDGELALCRALAELDPSRRDHVYWAARACFVRGPDQVPAFDAVFERFWGGLELSAPQSIAEHGESDPRMSGPQHGGESLPQFRPEGASRSLLDEGLARASREVPSAAAEEGGEGERRGMLAAYSPAEVLAEGEPLSFEADELAGARRLAQDLRAAAPERRSRRPRASKRRGRLDLRRTLRRSLRCDGELLEPGFSAPSRTPRRVVLLCDVSGSMDRYSRVLLASLQAAVAAGIRAEAFAFATRLTRLTRPLAGRDAERALERARAAVADWSGGTRIGAALAAFNEGPARTGLARGAIVIVVSDGWDRGDPDLLAQELERLRLGCRRLVWVNPRPRGLADRPLAVGMQVALAHVDDFVPGHDPRALAGLARLIGGLGAGRPARAQRPLDSVAR